MPGLWRNQGRLDDIITFSNAEKLNPIDFQATVESHSDVKHAIVAGQGRHQASLIIEHVLQEGNLQGLNGLLDSVWPTVQRANASCPTQGRVEKELILFTTVEKPPLFTDKLTVRKKATINAYELELNELYASFRTGQAIGLKFAQSAAATSDNTMLSSDLKRYLKEIFVERTGKLNLNDETDLRALGLDSLDITALNSKLLGFLDFHWDIKHFKALEIKNTLYKARSITELNSTIRQQLPHCLN